MPGVRVLTVSLFLIERVFDEGTDRCVPVEPVKLRVLASRISPRLTDAVEMLVQSESFPEEEANATWETAKPHNPSFRRWDYTSELWAPTVPKGARDVRFVYDVGDGVTFEARVPDGAREICGVDLSEPNPTALIRDEAGAYRHLPLVRVVAPSEPEEGPPV